VEKAESTHHRKFERFKLRGDQAEDSSNEWAKLWQRLGNLGHESVVYFMLS
jgi:hypothetical protein